MKWRHIPIVAFDTETTGLNPFDGDRIIEFGAVVLELGPDGRVANREDHSWLVNPGIPIPRKVTEITGITPEDLKGKPPFRKIAKDVHALLGQGVAVAHNFPFDMAFLTQELREARLDWPEPLAEVDTVDLSIKHFPDARSHKLADLCKRLDVVLEQAHRATDDAAACGHCLVELARRHEVDDDLQAMLDWARAMGRPPSDGPLGTDKRGHVVFTEGPHRGQPVAEHPLHLAWMEKARVRGPHGWQWRYPESARRWIRRWLDVRGSGRAVQNPKTFHSQDWVLDSCIAEARRVNP